MFKSTYITHLKMSTTVLQEERELKIVEGFKMNDLLN